MFWKDGWMEGFHILLHGTTDDFGTALSIWNESTDDEVLQRRAKKMIQHAAAAAAGSRLVGRILLLLGSMPSERQLSHSRRWLHSSTRREFTPANTWCDVVVVVGSKCV